MEDARLDRLLDNIPLTTLVRSARAILQLMPSMQGVAVEPTAHERRWSNQEPRSTVDAFSESDNAR